MTWFQQRFEFKEGRQHVACQACGRSMWFPSCKAGKYVTCGGACASALRAATKQERSRECATCGSQFTPRPRQIAIGTGRFCSQKCNTESHAAMNSAEAQAKARAAFAEAIASGRYVPAKGADSAIWNGGRAAYLRRITDAGIAAERLREYRKTNPHLVREWSARRAGRKTGRLPRGTVANTGASQRWKCACCKTDISRHYHVDHITPLARGGRHEPKNIQLLCVTCNVRKAAKDPIEFMQSRGYLL
jgi:hypothetical protein